jgi:hypothetical protein
MSKVNKVKKQAGIIYVGKFFGELELVDRVTDALLKQESIKFSAGYPYRDLSDNVCFSLEKRGYKVITEYSSEYYERDGVQRIGRSKITTVSGKPKA